MDPIAYEQPQGLSLAPFRALRPAVGNDRLGRLLCPPYDVITAADRAALLAATDPELRRALERYAQGQPVDLRPFKIDLSRTTPYRKKVLEAARRCGIEPTIIRQPGIAMDIDHPVDLAAFLRLPQSAGTRTRAFLESADIPRLLAERGIG